MELKLFTTPEEEMDLSILRLKVSKLYADAFKRIALVAHADHAHVALEVLSICEDTIEATSALADAHLKKWNTK